MALSITVGDSATLVALATAKDLDYAKSFSRSSVPVNAFVQSKNKATKGGILGTLSENVLHIDVLWLDESLRGRKWGEALLFALENRAMDLNAQFSACSTLEYQAPGFYTKYGYETACAYPGWPNKHKNFIMSKKLTEKHKNVQSKDDLYELIIDDNTQSEAANIVTAGLQKHNAPYSTDFPVTAAAMLHIHAKIGDVLVGGAIVYSSWSYIHLASLFVAPEFRRKGYGRKLIQHIENLAKEKGYMGVLASVKDTQYEPEKARKFLEGCGMVKQYSQINTTAYILHIK